MNHTIRLDACSMTDPGLKRPRNEDVCAADLLHCSFMVADGMGGVAGGEVASALFLEAVNETFVNTHGLMAKSGDELVRSVFLLANRKILDHAAVNPAHKGLGCTAELLTLSGDDVIVGHVGDSRTYLFQNGHLHQLTVDHSIVQEQVDLGVMTREQATKSRFRNVLTRAVGIDACLSVDIRSHRVCPGDIYLLCSDGLHGMLDDQEILPILAFDAPLSLKAEMLITMANDAGGKDNISVTLVEILH